MDILSKLSELEKEAICNYIGDLADGERIGVSQLETVLKHWYEHKDNFLFKLFNDNLILSKDIEYVKTEAEIRTALNHSFYTRSCWYSFTEKLTEKLKEHYVECPNPNLELYEKAQDLIFRLGWSEYLSTNEYSGPNVRFPLPNDKELVIPTGCKPMKILGKIAKVYDVYDEYEVIRLAHSRTLNDKKMTGKLCLSIHPLDFMTMSDNENDWTSCMSWWDKGEYRRGTIEMMNSPLVVVAYIVSEDKYLSLPTYSDNLKWNSKKWRQLFVIEPEIFISEVKSYPFLNRDLTAMVLNWIKELVETNLGNTNLSDAIYKSYFDEGNDCHEAVGYIDLDNDYIIPVKILAEMMYNDFGTLSYHSCLINKKIVDNAVYVEEGVSCDFDFSEWYWDYYGMVYEIDYSGPSTCMNCGEVIGYYDNCEEDTKALVCETCSSIVYCHDCGSRLSRSQRQEINGEYYCDYCVDNNFHTCPFTGGYLNRNDCHTLYVYEKLKEDITAQEFFDPYHLPFNNFNDCNYRYQNHKYTIFIDSAFDSYDEYFSENTLFSLPNTWSMGNRVRYGIFEEDLSEELKTLFENYKVNY